MMLKDVEFRTNVLPPFVEVTQDDNGKPCYVLRIQREDGSTIISRPISFRTTFWQRLFKWQPKRGVQTEPIPVRYRREEVNGNYRFQHEGKIKFTRIAWDSTAGEPAVQEWTHQDLQAWARQFELSILIDEAITWLLDENPNKGPFVYPYSPQEIQGLEALCPLDSLVDAEEEAIEQIKAIMSDEAQEAPEPEV